MKAVIEWAVREIVGFIAKRAALLAEQNVYVADMLHLSIVPHDKRDADWAAEFAARYEKARGIAGLLRIDARKYIEDAGKISANDEGDQK